MIAFLLVGVAGVAYSGMMMPVLHGLGEGGDHGDMGMTPCPLMGQLSAVCNMNPLAHVGMWQNMFAAIPVQSAVLLLLLLLGLFFSPRLKEYVWLLYPSPQPVYISYDSEVTAHDSLRRFIARGLMHPKIF